MNREMKDSGIKWLGDVPNYWVVKRGKYNFNKHKYIPGSQASQYHRLALTMKGVVPRSKEDADGLQPKDFASYQLLKKGELVFKLIDLQNYSTSRVGLSSYTGLVSPAYIVLNASGEVLPEFAEYFYLMLWHRGIFNALGDDGIRSNLSTMDLLNIPICYPSRKLQRSIVLFLNAKCSEIDGLLNDLDAEIKTLSEYKKALIAETVTRGLDSNVPMKQSGIPWVGDIPEHWKTIANKYIMHKKKEIVPVYNGQDIISLSMNGVIVRDLDSGGKMPTTFNGYQHIYPGNLLMCLFDIDVTPRCIGLIKNDGLTSPAYSQFVMTGEAHAPFYYYYYLKMDNNKELVHLAKNMRHSLNEEQFGMIKTILPPIDEQVAIAAFLDEKCLALDQSISDKQKQIETLKSYKASLIYEYVTGKKQVI